MDTIREVAVAILFLACGPCATAEAQVTDLIEVTVGVTPGITPDATATLRSDGSVFIDLPWPVPNETVNLPSWMIPPNPTPAPPVDIGNYPTMQEAKKKAAGRIALYLIGQWIDYAIDQLRQSFDDAGDPPGLMSETEEWEDFDQNFVRYTWLALLDELEANGG